MFNKTNPSFYFQKGPMRLYYSVFTNPAKRQKIAVEEPMILETDSANNSDLKTEVSGYFTDEEKHNSEISMTQETDESKTDSVLDGDSFDIENEEASSTDKGPEKTMSSPTKSPKALKETPNESKESVTKDLHKTQAYSVKGDSCDDAKKVDRKTVEIPSSVSDIETDKAICDADKSDKESEATTDSGADQKKKESELKLARAENKNDAGREKEKVEDSTCKDISKCKDTCENMNKADTQTEKGNTVEASTDTVPCTSDDVQIEFKQTVQKKTKSCITDEDVSEPVVSSTQNTQGCQTEPPESYSDTLDIPHSSDSESSNVVSPCHKSTVDVSCETDNFVVHRRNAKESVSVSTDTDDVHHVLKRKSVDCSTDVYDFPESDVELDKKRKIDSSTDFHGFPTDANKRKTLSVDCSTEISDIYMSSASTKQKVVESDSSESKTKKLDLKAPKRSLSYSGHLSTPKAAYLAQPLSPTKITLKSTQPKSPLKTCPKSPSRSETTGFQSEYQSFVMELPEKTYRFEDDEPPTKTIKPSTSIKTTNSSITMPSAQLSPSLQKKSVSKTGRPRGRPPKLKTIDTLTVRIKEKKHKSRSHSPKQKKGSDKERDRSREYISSDKTTKITKSFNQDKKSNAYSWINKIDTSLKSPSSSEQKQHKNKQEDQTKSEKPPSDLRIPKQFLYYSNGQYTLATVSSLNTLKQSSPVSPPPRTVFTAELNKKDKTESRPKLDNADRKIGKVNKPVKSENEPEESKQSDSHDKADDPKRPKTDSVKVVEEKSKVISLPKDSKPNDFKPPKTLNSQTQVVPQTTVQAVTRVIPKAQNSQSEFRQSRPSIVCSAPRPKTSKPSSTVLSTATVNPAATKDKPQVPPPPPKEKPAATTSAPLPEYRHQSPFFTSMSGAKLSTPHRPTTHLNIPNLNSHFSGTHPLYAQGRYASERLAAPLYHRSFSMSDNTSSQSTANYDEQRRREAMAFMSPFSAGHYLGLMHSHLVSSLPHHHLAQKGHYQESSKSLAYSDHATNGASSMSQNSNRPYDKPSTPSIKGKEKSIHKIITQITEKKKKETQEQVNGIDLSTKTSKREENNGKSSASRANDNKSEKKEDVECIKVVNNGRVETNGNKCGDK